MDIQQLSNYINRYCRFKLRSGKVVYGIIWQNADGNKVEHYFASAVEREKYIRAEEIRDYETCQKIKTPVDIDEIVIAEPLNA
ncbi:MAG: hypothetical protein AB1458_06910 [Bacteroidota bacterium]